MGSVRFTTFLVKVVSRCNISCDYCYVYEHNDQGWRDQPRLMSADTEARLADRLGEYAAAERLTRILVVFHGGEPLLAGADRLARLTRTIRARLSGIDVDVSVQTNGTLLDDRSLDVLHDAAIGVSLSLDGPAEVNDLHRLTPRGTTTFPAVMDALRRLRRHPATFTGVIAVIDPTVPPEDLLAFFAGLDLPALDLLLPDANYTRPPAGRDERPDLYVDWLLRAFDAWFIRYPAMPVRTFDSLVAAVAGVPGAGTDAFGLGDVSLLCIETDGSYHDLDVLKITKPGQTSLGAGVHDTAIADIADSPVLALHRRLLGVKGLAPVCQDCSVVSVCGGGAVPHRYSEAGFGNPTVYCREMYTLIRHVERRLALTVSAERERRQRRTHDDLVDLESFEAAAQAAGIVADLLAEWRTSEAPRLRSLAAGIAGDASQPDAVRQAAGIVNGTPDAIVAPIATRPNVVLWTRIGHCDRSERPLKNLAGRIVEFEPAYVLNIERMISAQGGPGLGVHRDDPWLRLPFGPPIEFLTQSEAERGRRLVSEALRLVSAYDPALASEIALLSPEIQFIRDNSAHPEKVVSFSDDAVPGALFLGLGSRSGPADVYDVAESIIHEHRHQKLYLLSRRVELVERDHPLVTSPWREEPRPPSGLLHAVWVFVELRRFWLYARHITDADVARRMNQLVTATEQRLEQAWSTLARADLTPAGRRLVAILQDRTKE